MPELSGHHLLNNVSPKLETGYTRSLAAKTPSLKWWPVKREKGTLPSPALLTGEPDSLWGVPPALHHKNTTSTFFFFSVEYCTPQQTKVFRIHKMNFLFKLSHYYGDGQLDLLAVQYSMLKLQVAARSSSGEKKPDYHGNENLTVTLLLRIC